MKSEHAREIALLARLYCLRQRTPCGGQEYPAGGYCGRHYVSARQRVLREVEAGTWKARQRRRQILADQTPLFPEEPK